MALRTLTLHDLRCIERAELEFSPGLNLIAGANGSGKTSILEGIFLLGRGRSFRTRNTERLIRSGQPWLRSVGRTYSDEPAAAVGEHVIGLQVARGVATEGKLDGEAVGSLTELAGILPVQVINPEIHRLIEDGPHRRRRWLDWAVFHVEPGFIGHWMRYQRALKQRNAALRRPAPAGELAAWHQELVSHGEAMTVARQRVLERLRPFWEDLAVGLSGVAVKMGYQRGWAEDAPLLDALAQAERRDRDRGTTSCGPHRAEVSLRVDGRAARDVLSRGQQKLIAIALVLAQLEVLSVDVGLRTTLLLDDPQAELDGDRVREFLARVRRIPCQLIVTSLLPDFGLLGRVERVFHVERGRVEQQ